MLKSHLSVPNLILIVYISLYPVESFRPGLPVPVSFPPKIQRLCRSRTTTLQGQPWKDSDHHRVDVINTSSTATVSNANGDRNDKPTVVRRNYNNFLWKKNDMTSQDYNINYRVEGPIDGHPILLVHGFGANVNHFRFQFPALVAEGYRVYAVDLLGFGASDKPNDADYSIELFVKLLADFVTTMDPNKKWIAAGNSIGGLCSLGLADKLPNTILGVILFNTSGGMNWFRYDQIPLLLRPILWCVQKFILGNPKRGGKFFERFKTRNNVQSILMTQGVYGNTTNVDDELLEILLGPSDDEGARDVFLKVFGGDPGPTPESFLAKIDCPVLALWGEADPWTVIAKGEAFGKHAKQYHLERIPGAGHCPHDEAPELVHKIMLPWLRDLWDKEESSESKSAVSSSKHVLQEES